MRGRARPGASEVQAAGLEMWDIPTRDASGSRTDHPASLEEAVMKPKKSSGKSAGKRSKKRSGVKELTVKKAGSVKGGVINGGVTTGTLKIR
jgi:hypothetical protein